MKKRSNNIFIYYVLYLALSFISLEGTAQDEEGFFNVGMQLGVTGSQVDGDGLSGFNKFGLIGGFFVNTELNEDFLLSMELNFIQKGSRKNVDAENNDYTFYKMSLNYAQVPLILTYHVSENLSFHAGPAIGFLLSDKEEYFDGIISNNPPFNKLEIGGVAGVQYKISEHLSGQIRADRSLLPIREKKNDTVYQLEGRQYNSVLAFSLLYFL